METSLISSKEFASQVLYGVHSAALFVYDCSGFFVPYYFFFFSLIYQPLMYFISGMVILQYAKFSCRQAARQSRLSFRLGTIGITLHLAQLAVDQWCIFHSFQYYASGEAYSYFLYEALQVCLTVGIILVVQYHFFVLAYATSALSKKWIIPLGLIYIGACAGGLGTSFEFFRNFLQRGFHSATPLVLHGRLLSFYVIWLGCNGLTDGVIAFALVRALHHDRGCVKHKYMKTTLSRLLAVIVNTFVLTYLVAQLSLISTLRTSFTFGCNTTTVPHIIPNFSSKAEMACQTTGFFMNSTISRIYLLSFSIKVFSRIRLTLPYRRHPAQQRVVQQHGQ
ncbi:hypothetical protein VP01_2474g1 [Puccinia sorghi]|uniref:Uncharacterized protein n=1 Tax=Puccinia sorghi TaxID=27349 RepID=A0A0L6V601_9BASI|nr:hypothetical protein VP01_2474g1 [Puccinia sorghi]